jgi:hypothetical protein
VDLVLFLLVLVVVAAWVSAPLRRGAPAVAGDSAAEVDRAARVAAVRDAELDAQMGKLTSAEHRELDALLRDEALAALREERAGASPAGPTGSGAAR